ncbi:hypothetical protein FVE85_4413 [Porphyridium purpureum]|uniref:Uncharacterized protein n=1 Tax=Porphyridium purpureum TaxID=35688 RepID=A0A5J4YIA9_PORPP|nr:hypothetical protein FVE85_4413 [Porphyridium purpureum]|eukprot:POR9523..scf270_19
MQSTATSDIFGASEHYSCNISCFHIVESRYLLFANSICVVKFGKCTESGETAGSCRPALMRCLCQSREYQFFDINDLFVCLFYPYTLPEDEALQLLSTLVTAVFIHVRSARGNPVPGKTSAPKRALKPVSGLRAPLCKPTSYSPGSVPFSETVPFSARSFLPIGLPASHRPVGRYSRSVGRAAFVTICFFAL